LAADKDGRTGDGSFFNMRLYCLINQGQSFGGKTKGLGFFDQLQVFAPTNSRTDKEKNNRKNNNKTTLCFNISSL
jgi:hypothetical protein